MDIIRINHYQDPRFSPAALAQHGCYLADGVPCEVRILTEDTAMIVGAPAGALEDLISAFRFHAPHITVFRDAGGCVIHTFPPARLLTLPLSALQPTQFHVDEEKLAAVRSFITKPEEIILQVLPHEGRYLVLDGHTRLYLAVISSWETVRAVAEEADDSIHAFAAEALRRGVRVPADMTLLPHSEYEVRWNRFCNEFLAALETRCPPCSG